MKDTLYKATKYLKEQGFSFLVQTLFSIALTAITAILFKWAGDMPWHYLGPLILFMFLAVWSGIMIFRWRNQSYPHWVIESRALLDELIDEGKDELLLHQWTLKASSIVRKIFGPDEERNFERRWK